MFYLTTKVIEAPVYEEVPLILDFGPLDDQTFPRDKRGFTHTTCGFNLRPYDIRWARYCIESFENIPDLCVFSAHELSNAMGVSAPTMKARMIYDSRLVRLSDRRFMLWDDYRFVLEYHPEISMLIKDHPVMGPTTITKLKNYDGKFPNGRELRKAIGENGFEALVKYGILTSTDTLTFRFDYYFYHTRNHGRVKIC